MKIWEEDSYMREDDRYDRVYYSTYYTQLRPNIIERIKNYLKTFYAPKK